LNAEDPNLLPQLMALMTPRPPPVSNRRRTLAVLDDGVQGADELFAAKRRKVENALGDIIAAQGS
jgi:hypothetical protein